jgi:hypothetical protein
MSKFIPVEPEKWAEMVKAMADNARLKAEVERLQMEQKIKAIPVEARLVDRIAELKAQVERLTKAGDAMEMTLQADFNGCPYEPTIVREAIVYWRNAKHAAKEGKQS